jgi:hypothetical protein
MNHQEIIVEINLGITRAKDTRRCVILISVLLLAFVLCLFFPASETRQFACTVTALLAGLASLTYWELSKWKKKPGYYRIYIDSIGLHVHSDEPRLGKSFSIASSQIHSLIRKEKDAGDIYEYFVEEACGRRHEIKTLPGSAWVDVMIIFDRIADHYPAVKLMEERG